MTAATPIGGPESTERDFPCCDAPADAGDATKARGARFWIDADGEGEQTIWTGNPDRPTAILRRCEISADDATRDEVMRRIGAA